MKKLIKILFFLLILVFSAATCYAQEVTVPTDTTKSVRNKTESKENNQDQNQNQSASQDNSKGQNAGGAKSVKSVNSARPDWSKAKGARPNIVRPSGSGVPKGAGKPGGAGRIRGR